MGYVILKYDLSRDLDSDATCILGVYNDFEQASRIMLSYFTQQFFEYTAEYPDDYIEELIENLEYDKDEDTDLYTRVFDGIFEYRVLPYEV
jgi:hypothetical protein